MKNLADAEETAYHCLSAYTLQHADRTFVHQYVVDAWAAQRAGPTTKAITLTFALIGLYLSVERGFSGRDVQRVHMLLARRRRSWPSFPLPQDRGRARVTDVVAAPPGPERDAMIARWCGDVWTAYAGARAQVIALLETYLP